MASILFRYCVVAAPLVASLMIVQPAGGQELDAADTIAILHVVLHDFRTVNGPIIELAPTVVCRREAERRGAGGAQCPSAAAAMDQLAPLSGATIPDRSSPVPACRWSHPPADAKGLRLTSALVLRDNGRVHATVTVRCANYGHMPPAVFLETLTYELGRADGGWRIERILGGFIT